MNIKRFFVRSSLVSVLGVVLTLSLATCAYCPEIDDIKFCQIIQDAPLTDLTSSSGPDVVFEKPCMIVVYHGSGCAVSDKSGTEEVLKVEQSLDLPVYVGDATVILNGWRVRYLSKDHHVGGLGTQIRNIRKQEQTLKWEAAGVLSDKNFDDGYTWCYYYTVLGWNPAALSLLVDHEDVNCGADVDPSQTNFFGAFNEQTTTALASFPSFLQISNFRSGMAPAILPRGFGFGWECGDDHHMLQIGYNLVHSESFIEHDKLYKKAFTEVKASLPNLASQVDSGFVSWETSAIFKDDKARRNYFLVETVSGLAGNAVGVIQPPFSILPVEDGSGCTPIGDSPSTQDFLIENVPFAFAIPMLTGWTLSYGCGDEHITEAGIW